MTNSIERKIKICGWSVVLTAALCAHLPVALAQAPVQKPNTFTLDQALNAMHKASSGMH